MTGNQEKQPKINLAVKAAEDDLLGMYSFISRLETMADEKTVRRILYRVRHGLRRSLTVSLRAEWYDLC